MPPRPRKSFYLAFSKDPPAADVVRNDNVISFNPFKFRYEKTVGKGDWVEVEGEIKDQGFKKDLDQVKLDSDGQPCAADDPRRVGTRKQELEKLRMAQVNAQRLQLQRVAEEMLDEGADVVASALQPVVKTKRRPCLPKKRSPAVMAQLQQMVRDMPCFKAGGGRCPVLVGKPIFCDAGKLLTAKLKLSSKPKELHKKVLKLCVPEKILRLEGLSVTGKRGCVAIDPIINETISLMVVGQYIKVTGGKATDAAAQYDPDYLLENLITNTRKLKGAWRLDTDTSSAPSNDFDAQNVPVPTFSGSSNDSVFVSSNLATSISLNSSTPSASISTSSINTFPSCSSSVTYHNSDFSSFLNPSSSLPPPTVSYSTCSPSVSLFAQDHGNYTVTDISSNAVQVEVDVPFQKF